MTLSVPNVCVCTLILYFFITYIKKTTIFSIITLLFSFPLVSFLLFQCQIPTQTITATSPAACSGGPPPPSKSTVHWSGTSPSPSSRPSPPRLHRSRLSRRKTRHSTSRRRSACPSRTGSTQRLPSVTSRRRWSLPLFPCRYKQKEEMAERWC